MKSRKVTIYDFEILSVEGSRASFRLRCSAGTYVRSIAHDLGAQLGIGGHLVSLRRTSIGDLHVDQALPTARMREMGPEEILASPHFRPMCAADLPLTAADIDPAQEQRMLHGQSIITKLHDEVERGEMVSVSNLREELVAIAVVANVLSEGGPVELQPKIVLK